jgi:CheY-specific phosphatase CheX
MITGNATALLNQRRDLSLKITTPAIATGEKLSINLVPKPALVLGLYTQYGPIEINIALEEQVTLSEIESFSSVLQET